MLTSLLIRTFQPIRDKDPLFWILLQVLFKTVTLGSETFANFANVYTFCESLFHEKFGFSRFAKVYAREKKHSVNG